MSSPSTFQSLLSTNNPLVSLPLQAATNLGYAPLVSIARSSVLSVFARLQVGLLTIHDVSDGSVKRFGDDALVQEAASSSSAKSNALSNNHQHQRQSRLASSSSKNAKHTPQATLIVNKDTFWLRMLFGSDLGFSEAFMANEVDTPELGACFDVSRQIEAHRPADHLRLTLYTYPFAALHPQPSSPV